MNTLLLKKKLTPLVMWSIKNHWIFLVLLIGLQYLTGEQMTEPKAFIPLSAPMALQIHSILGKLILIGTAALFLDKMYLLWLRRRPATPTQP